MSPLNIADDLDATALAALVRRGEVSAEELVHEALSRIEALNPQVNAVVATLADQALAHARAGDRSGWPESAVSAPFAGVPFLLKDMHQEWPGAPHTEGSGLWAGRVSTVCSPITALWLRAGLVPVGVSNACEFGLKPQTESRHWGAVHNPWRRGLSAGGSSGGAAAAVACGMVPMAGGNDVGGSIRIPASACGLFGFKPGRGRVPWSASEPQAWAGAPVHHALTRSVRDSAALLDAVCAGPAQADHTAPLALGACVAAIQRPCVRVRIGVSAQGPTGFPVDPEVAQAVEATALRLADLGHHVEWAAPAWDATPWRDQVEQLMLAIAHATVESALRHRAGMVHRLEPDTRLAAALGQTLSAQALHRAMHDWQGPQQVWARFQQRFDVWLHPVVGRAALPLGAWASPDWQVHLARWWVACTGAWLPVSSLLERGAIKARREAVWAHVQHTPLANWLGLPAMSVPTHTTADGLPVGVQLWAGAGQEPLLMALAADLERAGPWGGPKAAVAQSPCQL